MTKEAFSPAGRSAAEISKGATEILVLSEVDVMACIDLSQLLDVLEDGFKALSQGKVVNPPRPQLNIPGAGYSLAMPAWMEGMNLTVKVVNVFEGNLAKNLPSHLATISLFDPLSGLPVCIMDGTFITAVRTSGSAVLSVRALARRDARIATVVGAGVQANQHLHLLPLVRDFAEIRVASKSFDDAAALARLHPSVVAVADLEAAVRSSDVVCLATHSYEPVIEADWVRPGTHVSSVGVAPPGGEMPIELIGKFGLFVETRAAFEPTPVGSCELAGFDPDFGTDLGAMLLDRAPGRVSDQQITTYKAMGIAMEDMVAADLAYRCAKRLRKGKLIVL
ncbi:MAG: ornithine cyclodeaminase family protein [Mesorhizobium sp.]|jgi:alanine dehydrogenase|uniref:ornithine cyclodeaminase family protein n=1 Tax=Mesorhizobium sp. TaxID=1871066 RepID=UPI001226F2DF|nr:ornithine cyclodeaminase family protein [Mesorhizobium sp.]TIM13174.1 MAG: ornithine cyclodeaminase family protein [Mesorhizobium sp.]